MADMTKLGGRLTKIISIAVGLLWFSGAGSWAQQPGATPLEPFHIIGNIYYVGEDDDTSFLIVTPEGHILLDTGEELKPPLIRASVEKLGFSVRDIKFIIHSHAHADHVAGDYSMKEMTRAKILAMEGDVPAMTSGKTGDFQRGWRPFKVDQTLRDGEQIRLGGVTMVARLTPGHTKGCTTWTMVVEEGGKKYNVVFVCSVRISSGLRLVGNSNYPDINQDFVKAFRVLKSLPCDVFLAAHGSFFKMKEKIKRLEQGGANPFIDPEGYRAYLENSERAYFDNLRKQGGAP